MSRMRSPGYPGVPLSQAIDLVRLIHSKSRTNVIDRESAAKDMGYSGLTGRSLMLLAALAQFDLVGRAGKGDLKVTPTAVSILHGISPQEKLEALRRAGHSPRLFRQLYERFPDGIPSENVIRSYLIQQGFADVAIGPAIKSFMETNRFLEDAGVSESHGEAEQNDAESMLEEGGATVPPPPPPAPVVQQHGGYQVMEGERVVFSEEVGSASYLKLVANGEMNVDLLDALADFIKRQKRRLGIPDE